MQKNSNQATDLFETWEPMGGVQLDTRYFAVDSRRAVYRQLHRRVQPNQIRIERENVWKLSVNVYNPKETQMASCFNVVLVRLGDCFVCKEAKPMKENTVMF